jgi:hypothetical protein
VSLEHDAFGALKVARVKGSPKTLYWRSTTLEYCGCLTGRLSPNTNTAEGTLTQESGDVRSVEGEVCGAVLVDE